MTQKKFIDSKIVWRPTGYWTLKEIASRLKVSREDVLSSNLRKKIILLNTGVQL